MSEYYQQPDGRRKLGRLGSFLVGLFGGGLAGASVTAYFVKRKMDSDREEAVKEAEDKAATEATKQAQAWINEHVKEPQRAMEQVKREIDRQFGRKVADFVDADEEKAEYILDGIPVNEDIEDYNLDIDDDDATKEAQERSEQHERYLDMVEKYNGNPELKPRRISQEEFSNNHYMEKVFITWYEDNVFGIDQENDHAIEDPYADFGVVHGLDLFSHPDPDDPDVVHIRNEGQSIDYEITRAHMTYASLGKSEANYG